MVWVLIENTNHQSLCLKHVFRQVHLNFLLIWVKLLILESVCWFVKYQDSFVSVCNFTLQTHATGCQWTVACYHRAVDISLFQLQYGGMRFWFEHIFKYGESFKFNPLFKFLSRSVEVKINFFTSDSQNSEAFRTVFPQLIIVSFNIEWRWIKQCFKHLWRSFAEQECLILFSSA